MKKKKPLVSIIIVSYNTKELLLNCLQSIKDFANVPYEVVISDNGSTDGTVQELRRKNYKRSLLLHSELCLIENGGNLGFAKGNNIARKYAKGEYVLFLNPDTLLQKKTLSKTVEYMEKHPEVGALTCKVMLPSGELDKDTRRSFPTPFVAMTHFSGLDRLFPRSKMFARYWYGYVNEDETQEIDSLQGAYFLARREILDKVGWFDEDYFLDGEDIDLCFRIKKAGYKIVYLSSASITHIKKGSKFKNKSLRSVIGGMNAMEIFYRKRLWNEYSLLVNYAVIFGIRMLKAVRVIKYYLA